MPTIPPAPLCSLLMIQRGGYRYLDEKEREECKDCTLYKRTTENKK